MNHEAESLFDESAARRVLLVRACDLAADATSLWTPEDRAWATRLARQTLPAAAPAARCLDERAHHALQRLLPRDATLARALQMRVWRPVWVPVAALLGLLAGIAVDSIGGAQRINLMAPPVWAVVLWNLAVYAALPWPWKLPAGPRGWLARRWAGPRCGSPVLLAYAAAWTRAAAALHAARAALLLHTAAAALGLGLIGGMYLRGLVLDYRAGWQSTFLDAAQVRAVLALLLAPASALSGIAVPDVAALQALRVGPEALPAASAAPWIGLYAATLVLVVVLPRLALALAAAGRAHRLSRRIALALAEPYFQRLLRELQGGQARVQWLPLGEALSPQALQGLRAALAAGLGAGVDLQLADPVAYGAEDDDAGPRPAPGTTLCLIGVTLASTPEDDTHGRLVDALRGAACGVPLVLLVDEAGYAARFAALPDRIAERRVVWQRWAARHGLGCVVVNLLQPDLAACAAAWERALRP